MGNPECDIDPAKNEVSAISQMLRGASKKVVEGDIPCTDDQLKEAQQLFHDGRFRIMYDASQPDGYYIG